MSGQSNMKWPIVYDSSILTLPWLPLPCVYSCGISLSRLILFQNSPASLGYSSVTVMVFLLSFFLLCKDFPVFRNGPLKFSLDEFCFLYICWSRPVLFRKIFRCLAMYAWVEIGNSPPPRMFCKLYGTFCSPSFCWNMIRAEKCLWQLVNRCSTVSSTFYCCGRLLISKNM